MFKPIEDIKVNGANGEIFNHYIYGSNLELGFSESPTKLTLNIVSKQAQRQIPPVTFPINLTTSYSIDLGGFLLSKMYLYSYEKNDTVGQSVATLNFIDGSFILDKIFVGLINRHYQLGNGPEKSFIVPVNCTTCDGRGLVKRNGTFKRKAANGVFVQGDAKSGGSIMLGQEQFVEGICDIPDVTYNFSMLKKGMSQFGIKTDIPDINPKYFQSYVGTLREVLSNWCADFGYTFYWDPKAGTLRNIDLKIPTDNTIAIKNIINSSNTSNGLALESYSESQSLEGTVDQKHISRYLRPARTKTIDLTSLQTRSFPCIKPEKFNVNEEAITRAVLGKYNDNARTLYCMKNLANNGKYIGLTEVFVQEIISSEDKTDNIFTKIYEYGYKNDALTNFINNYNGAQVLIAVYNPALKEKYKTWESSVADMMGKYYQSSEEPIKNYRQCDANLVYTRSVSLTPSAEKYTDKNKYDLPFANAIAGPEGVDGVEWDIPTLWLFSRNATYGTTENDYNINMLNPDGTDPLEKMITQYLPIEGAAYTLLFQVQSTAQKNKDQNTLNKVNQIIGRINELKQQSSTDGERKVVFVFLPPKETLDKGLITKWTFKNNELENFVDEKEVKKEEACVTECERSLIEEACGKCKDQPTPYVGLNSTSSRTLRLESFGKKIDLICPCEQNYHGYETVTTQQKIVVQGQKLVFGSVGNVNSNSMSLQVIESDITNDLIETDGSSVINMFVPDGNNIFSKITPAAYHNDLTAKLVNSITSPRSTINVSIIGTNLGQLAPFVDPAQGLNSYNISLNENGATSQLTFSNRPKVLPKREAISQKIAPTIKLNTYGRSE